MKDIVKWLESAEGEAWSLRAHEPIRHYLWMLKEDR